MTASASPHRSCQLIQQVRGTLNRTAIHRFVVGEDTTARELSAEEASAELGDPFARLLLLNGVFPDTAVEVLAAFDAATPDGDPLSKPKFFVLGEGSQLPVTDETSNVQRNLRFIASCGNSGLGPDIVMSTFNPDGGDIELMAWDPVRGGFNYYTTVSSGRAWVFAGNSHHALSEPTQGKGPFESHLSGSFVMKELRSPWMNWDSPAAPIQASVAAQSNLADHPWFTQKEMMGAITCEEGVARPSITRWAKARFDKLAASGTVADPARVMTQILETPAVNRISSHTESANPTPEPGVELPQTFFIDSEALHEVLGLAAPPSLSVPVETYRRSLETFEFTMSDGDGFSRPGDTHFAFFVPERAFEDLVVVKEAIRIGLVTDRLAASLLMTDFPNPVFSPRRASLMQHVPPSATLTNGASSFSEDMAAAILAAAEASAPDSAEGEFAERWATGDSWKERFNELLTAYYSAVVKRTSTQAGFDAFMRLAESRRQQVHTMPISEFPLLFANNNIPAATRTMRIDATVTEG